MSKILIDEEFWNGHTYSEVEEYIKGKLGSKANSADLATIATSGSYDDLSDKPTIPDISGKADSSDVYTKTEVYTKGEIDALLSDFVTEEIVDKSYGYHQNIKFIDLGVRLNGDKILFAESNIGASSPEELGTYFAWGETTKRYQDYPIEVDWIWSSYSLSSDGVGSDFTKYKYSSEFFSQADDAANVNLGGKWRTPTVGEIEKLLECTSRVWTNNYNGTGVSGFVIRGQGDYSDNSIFLPASGYMKNDLVGDVVMPTEKYKGVKCAYWTSSISVDSNDADTKKYSYSLVMDSSNSAVSESIERYCGLPIRPVVVVKDNAQEKIHRYSLNYQDGGAGFEIGGLIYYKTGNNRYELQNAENWKRSDDSDIRYKFKIDENIAGTNFGYSYYYNSEKYINSPYGGWKTIDTTTLYTIFGTGNGVRYSLVYDAASNRISGTTVNGVDGCRFAKISITDLNKTGVLLFPNNETFVGAQLPVMDEPYFVPPEEGQSTGTWSYSTSAHQNEITESELNEYISQGAYFLEKDVYWTRSMSEIGVGYHWPIYYLGSGEVDLSGIGVYDGLSVAMNAIYIRNIPWWLADCDDISHDVISTNVTPANLSDRIDNLENTKVDKTSGKGLSTNDYTTEEKTKLSGIATGAQVNVIETVKVNGTTLTSENKAVDVTVPTKVSDLDNDSGYLTSHQDISGKVDKVEGKGLSTEDYTTEEKTKLSGIATGAQVNVIETVKVNGTTLTSENKAVDITVPDVSSFITKSVNDLTNYYTTSNTYTKTEVDNLIGGIEHFKYKIATSTSAVASPKSNILYLIGPIGDGSEDIDRYEEYVYPSAAAGWTKIGDTTIDLSDYVTTEALNTALANYTLSSNIPVEKGTGTNSVQQKGSGAVASGNYSVAEGDSTRSVGEGSHAEGLRTTANGARSHTEGSNTVTNNDNEHAEGRYNNSHKSSNNFGNSGNTLHSIGIGYVEDEMVEVDGEYETSPIEHRVNAFEVMQDGKVYVKGINGYDGTNPGSNRDLASIISEKFTTSEKTKLEGIASGAEVNVQSNWNETNTSSDAYILNKPGIDTTPTYSSNNLITSGGVFNYAAKKEGDLNQDFSVDSLYVRGTGQSNGIKLYNSNYSETSAPALYARLILEGNVQSPVDYKLPTSGVTGGSYVLALKNDLTSKVDKVSGKGLSTNDYTTDEKNKLSGIASGAQVNVLEGVKVNGVAQTITDKKVNITIPVVNGAGISSVVQNGSLNSASGNYSFATGSLTSAKGTCSHTEGCSTNATNMAEHSEGNFNISNKASDNYGDSGNTQHSVGIGTSASNKKNAHEIMQNGDHYIYGIGGYDGTNPGVARRIQDALMQCTGVKNIISLTKAEYDALANKDSDTIYVVEDSHDYVDLGLRDGNNNKILFATCNIGASSPEEYGDYFAWGETSKRYIGIGDYDSEEDGYPILGSTFNWDTCPYCNSDGSKFSKYTENVDEVAESGTADGKSTLDSEDDVATVLWGENWRMPDQSDLEYLISNNVTSTWIDNYNETGVCGFLINGKDTFSEASLFLPASGFIMPASGEGEGTHILGRNTFVIYQSRKAYGIAYVINFIFEKESGIATVEPGAVRYFGLPVRPVHVGDVVPSYKLYKGSAPINDTYSKSEIDEKIGDIESILVTI